MKYWNPNVFEGTPPPGWPFPDDHRWLRSPAERASALVYLILAGIFTAIFLPMGLAMDRLPPRLILFAIATGFAVPFGVAGYRLLRRYRRVRDTGIEVTGTVANTWAFSTGTGSRTVLQYALAVRFPLADGSDHLAGQIHPGWYRKLTPGDRVRLKYHPEDPRYFSITPG